MADLSVSFLMCSDCGERPPRPGRRQCPSCAWKREDRTFATRRARIEARTGMSYAEWKRHERAKRGVRTRGSRAEQAERRRIRIEALAEAARLRPPSYIDRLRHAGVGEGDAQRISTRLHHHVHLHTHRHSLKAQRWQALARATADGSVTMDALIDLLLSGSLCADCDRELTPVERSIDHVDSLALGGAHAISNMRIVCVHCNRSKGGRLGSLIVGAMRRAG